MKRSLPCGKIIKWKSLFQKNWTKSRSLTAKRINTLDGELNRVLGGGLVYGSIILVGGQPGIGKSTLMLQLALNQGSKVLYVSGEESEEQIKMRADRIGRNNSSCYIYTDVNVSNILKEANKLQPDIIIIDSIQTLVSPYIESTPGSISQVRECTGELQRYAKITNIPIFVIGHITKEGGIAGPKLLEHIVDVVLQFEGETIIMHTVSCVLSRTDLEARMKSGFTRWILKGFGRYQILPNCSFPQTMIA
jgi:DNA repair protein RadA/Sms